MWLLPGKGAHIKILTFISYVLITKTINILENDSLTHLTLTVLGTCKENSHFYELCTYKFKDLVVFVETPYFCDVFKCSTKETLRNSISLL